MSRGKPHLGIREPNRCAIKAWFFWFFSGFSFRNAKSPNRKTIMRKLKLLWCFAVLRCHVFAGTRKKTKQCCCLARLFDAVTAKRGRLKPYRFRLSCAHSKGQILISCMTLREHLPWGHFFSPKHTKKPCETTTLLWIKLWFYSRYLPLSRKVKFAL